MLTNERLDYSQAVDPVVIPWGEGLVGGVANSGKLVNVIHADHVIVTFSTFTFPFSILLLLSRFILVMAIIIDGQLWQARHCHPC